MMAVQNSATKAAQHPLHSEPYEAARMRWASLSDAQQLASLYNTARGNQVEDQESMQDWLEQGGGLILEDASGKMLCALRWREIKEGWEVDRIATLPEARGRSYGRWLMTKVEALAIKTNIAQLTLTLDEVREDLLHYYKRMGYALLNQTETKATLEKRVGGVWQYKQ